MYESSSKLEPLVRLLTPTQVSELTGLAVGTLAKMRLNGRGSRFIKLGASVRYREDDVRVWLSDQPLRRSTSDTGPSTSA